MNPQPQYLSCPDWIVYHHANSLTNTQNYFRKKLVIIFDIFEKVFVSELHFVTYLFELGNNS